MQGSHVIFLADTWLSPQQNQDTIILKDFYQYWLDSTHVSSHRGMLMYIKQKMKQTLTHMWDTKFLELCQCDIPFQNTKLQLVCLYKPPTTLLKQFKHESIRKVLFETELKFCSKVTSFRSQTWLLLLVCLGKCFPFEKPKDCCSIQF